MQVLATQRKVILGSELCSGFVRNKPLDEERIRAAEGIKLVA